MTSDGTEQATGIVGGDQDKTREETQPPESSPHPGIPMEGTVPSEGADPAEGTVPAEDARPEEGTIPAESAAAVGAGASRAGSSGSGLGVLGGIAVVSSGLGLSSLIGNPLSDMLRARQEIVGQIEAGTGGGDQIEAFYGAPWHTTALVNGIIALVAVVIGAVVLFAHARRADKQPWVTAVAVGGVVLGLLGVLLAGGMYLDLFAAQPELPAAPQLGAGG
ncbi:hypothetical protein FHS23_001629 [Prauserella isguenensis]|uniref:Uncharacterized protein n=1 Tax=Prauserella isguenensis TaxID=1470180 RepID=A0A839S011_9PSEU|nr:hypothetical protein [Prauserella isguenensis]MBB3050634.1 hypothetical protein [Prauserella isguenensis]